MATIIFRQILHLYSIFKYSILRSDRSIRGHGGCAAMIHNKFMTNVVSMSSFAGYIEYLHFKVSIKGKKLILF